MHLPSGEVTLFSLFLGFDGGNITVKVEPKLFLTQNLHKRVVGVEIPPFYHLILASKFSLPNVFVFSTNERNVCDICVKYHIRKSSFDSNFCAFLL